MGIPQKRMHPYPIPSRFTWGAEYSSSDVESFEMGGVGISDPSGGLLVKIWYARLVDDDTVFLSADDVPEFVLFSLAGMKQMDFCFDQNMKPCLAYNLGFKDGYNPEEGHAYFWWYDTTQQQYETVDLGLGSYDCRCILDDKRDSATVGNWNDICLFYLRDGALYYREQRERFEIEHPMNQTGIKRLIKAGFTDALRINLVTKR